MEESENKDVTEIKNLFTVRGLAEKNKQLGTWPDTEAAIWNI
jgi:hypothetical protein